MKAWTSLMLALLGTLLVAAGASAQSIAVAADDDCIAVFADHLERQLLRVHFDQAAGKVAFSPFGPPGIETFAVAPKGAFVVYTGLPGSDVGRTPHLFLLDATGKPTGTPVPSPIGVVENLAVSPRGDRVAVSSDRGWISLFAVERAVSTLRLQARATFGVSVDRAFTHAFRPDGGIVTMTDDWVATFRTPDGTVQRVLDLKTVNRDLEPIDRSIRGLFRLRWSPRGDRFTVNWGSGPMFTKIFDATGRLLSSLHDFPGTEVEYIEGGDAAIVSGMTAPVVVRMADLAAKPFDGREPSVTHIVALSGGRRILALEDDRVALRSTDGKQLIAPTGFLNYVFEAALPGADDEAIVAAKRGGWIDLFTKQGKFVRRVQLGLRSASGELAVSADGTVVAAFDGTEIATLIRPTAGTWRGAFPGGDYQHQHLAVAGNGSRIVAAGPDNTVRIWSRDGGRAAAYELKVGGESPDRTAGLAVSPEGDIVVIVDEKAAAWFLWPADRTVRRVALPGQPRVAVLTAQGFAFGLADGKVVRVGRDGSPRGEPIKASELGGVGQIAVADDGESFMVVEEDQLSVRRLDWTGRVLAGPFRPVQPGRIRGAFFDHGRAMLILSQEPSDGSAGEILALRELAASPPSGLTYFERPR